VGLKVTVAICTRNRARHLNDALTALAGTIEACPMPPDTEVLVVDNGSTDDTPAVVSAMRNALPLRRVMEPHAGLSRARNRAVREAGGDYLAWLDDDAVVDPGWLHAYAEAIRRHPGAAFFGGPIRPRFEGEPPAWLLGAARQIGYVYSAIDLGAEPRELEARRDLPYGANYVVRRSEQLRLSYDTRLGRQPGSAWLAGEESALLGLLLDAGKRGRWVPHAAVDHVIPAGRQTLRYLLAHGYGMGRTDARRKPVAAGSGAVLLGRPRWLWRRLLRAAGTAASACVLEQAAVWVPAVHGAAAAAGRLRDYRCSVEPEIADRQRLDSRSQE